MNLLLENKSSKPHYEILDGLRGVAAILVVFFHIFEVFSNGDHSQQIINHGYLAVDFFFLLSGFVLGYAYDDRWNNMTLKDFFKRRIIRLQPMIIMGTIIGAVLYYFQSSKGMGWAGISEVPIWTMLLVMVIGFTLFPVGENLDIRGWGEMHPLNGAAWSLFYEYIANIAYALFLRRASKIILIILTIVAAGITVHYALTNSNGDIIGGWSISDLNQLKIGFIRLSFPFLAGLLLARIGKLKFTPNAFLTGSILLVITLTIPHLGGENNIWNRLYECVCLILVFPFIIWLGAGGKVTGKKSSQFCKFMGDISYPIYITHFPIVYVFMAYVTNNNLTLAQAWPYGLLVVVISITLAYCSMRWYDLPIRSWLRKKYL